MGKDQSHIKTKKSLLVNLSLAAMAGAFPAQALAQNVTCIEPLVFGEIITCGAAGTVTVRPDNTSTSSCVTVGGAPQSRGRCFITQSGGIRSIQVTVSSSGTVNSGGDSMNVNAVNIVTNSGGTSTTFTAPFFDLPIGATLNVGASQPAGTYSGTLGVTAVFN
ncbi:MAG: DUF4402 domain-containing protein [Pseudomonadota bacterium]